MMVLLSVVGKFLISVGVGVLLFVAWTLWGTGLLTQREQARLAREFEQQQPFDRRPKGTRGPPKGYRPGPGDPVFRLLIPAIGLNSIVVEGVKQEQLALGPGHYPSCRRGFDKPLCTESDEVWPGERGRVIVSGHRTTHGAPFWDLDKLRRGDRIVTRTKWGNYAYEVSGRDVVEPNAREIANPGATDGSEIVFTTCNPKYSAAQRLIVFAQLETILRAPA
jgi:sortase A